MLFSKTTTRVQGHEMFLLLPWSSMVFVLAEIAFGDTSSDLPRPAGFWPLTKRFGGLDVSGNGNHAIVQGVDFDAGIYGIGEGSAKFAGTVSSYIEIPNNGALNVTSFTWLAYVHLEDMSNQGPLFNFRRSENNYEYGTHIWAIVSGSLYLRPLIKEPYSEAQSYYLPVLSNTAWVYAGFTYDFQTGIVKLWVNGVEVGQLQNTPQLNLITDTPVRMGARHSSAADTRYFSGAMKCVQWYGTALSAEQIQTTVELCREPIYGAQLKVHQGYVMGIDASLTYRSEHDVHSLTECAALCCRDCSCLSVNFLETTATCELSKYSNVYNSSLELTRRSDREVYAELLHPGNKLYH